MGSSSSLLGEDKRNFIKAEAQAQLKNFSSIYRKQYSLAYLSHVHDELVQRKQEHSQLLKQRHPPQEAELLYFDNILYFDDNRRWKDRFAVIRASYSLECYESYETFMKGMPPFYKLQPTGGIIFTTEETYMEMVDKCFPNTDCVKEDFAPPVVGMPGQFSVYLHLPYQRDYYFCFLTQDKQTKFISILSDCIRHQNQDFLKNKMYEVQAFIKAVQLYRQEKGHYEPWDMMIGNNVQVLANLTMEDLLPSLEKDLLPRLKAKKVERKRIWFTTVDTAYNLVQETLLEGMTALNAECRETAKTQSALLCSNMDDIMSSRSFLENKLRVTVAESAIEYCMQYVEPNLPAVLEEIMEPISLGFMEARQLSEGMIETVCQNYQEGMTKEDLQQALTEMSKPNLEMCYEKVSGLHTHIQELQKIFTYPNCKTLEHSTQIDIEQLVKNVVYTFELLLTKAPQDADLMNSMVKARHRVLKQYDYDSSTLRKRIFQEALMSVTLPSIKAHLAPTFKQDLPDFEQYIFADYVNFINVENVYEDILRQILGKEVNKVVREAANMKKFNLFTESRYNFSVSSLHSNSPDSPAGTSPSPTQSHAIPAFPLLSNSPAESQNPENPVTAVKEAQQVEVQHQAQEEELAEIFECVKAGEEDKCEEKSVLNIPVIKVTCSTPEPVLQADLEETFAAALNLKEKTEDKTADVPTVITTETSQDMSSLVNTEHVPETGSQATTAQKTSSTTEVSAVLEDEPTTTLSAQDLSDDSSWVTEEEEEVDITEDDDPLVVKVLPEPEPEEPVMVMCEAISDAELRLANSCVGADAEVARAPDCIKEIRNLVTEVKEVEVTVHCHEDNEETIKEFEQTQ
ncbi:protein Niban 1a [Trichomycterus rosablanca]|uniref:protein Niban 1a n=1 Tax=Trichomycterus rosablanca TaxID=2290929 RepID=UPI002F352764